jgi:hypothetical protein
VGSRRDSLRCQMRQPGHRLPLPIPTAIRGPAGYPLTQSRSTTSAGRTATATRGVGRLASPRAEMDELAIPQGEPRRRIRTGCLPRRSRRERAPTWVRSSAGGPPRSSSAGSGRAATAIPAKLHRPGDGQPCRTNFRCSRCSIGVITFPTRAGRLRPRKPPDHRGSREPQAMTGSPTG